MTRRPGAPALLLGLSFLGFVSIGLPDGLLGVAWPSIRSHFGLPLDALGALLVAVTVGYVGSSAASGWILARTGVGTLLAASCLATAASLLGYASASAWPAVVAFGVLAGLGAGAIDAGLNTHVATRHSARTLGLLHACYGVGTTAGPALMTSVLMAGLPWQRGYAMVGAAQLALGAAFAATRGRWPGPSRPAGAGSPHAPLASTLRLRSARLAIAAFLLYTGLEAAAGAWIFSVLSMGRGLPMAAAGSAASVYWGGLAAGRVAFALLPAPWRPRSPLRACAALMALACAGLAADLGPAATLAAAALLGAAAGPVFPTLIATTPGRVGPQHTANAVGLQVAAAAVGQAGLPALLGILAEAHGLEIVPQALLGASLLLLAVHHGLERMPAARRLAAARERAPATEPSAPL
jgi:fucose permease